MRFLIAFMGPIEITDLRAGARLDLYAFVTMMKDSETMAEINKFIITTSALAGVRKFERWYRCALEQIDQILQESSHRLRILYIWMI